MVQKSVSKKSPRFSVNIDTETKARVLRFSKRAKRKPANATRYLIQRGLEAENA